MGCHYVRTSVLADQGMEELIDIVIDQCVQLENQVSRSILSDDTSTEDGSGMLKNNYSVVTGPQEPKKIQLTAGQDRVGPLRLNVKSKTQKKCCLGQ